MGKRVYWETLKNWAKEKRLFIAGGATPFAILIIFLLSAGSIEVIDYTGDIECDKTSWDDTEATPCIAKIRMKFKEDIAVFQTDYDPWGRNSPWSFVPEVKDWRMGRSWGSGIRWYNLSEPCKGTWCGASPGAKPTENSAAFIWREGAELDIYIEVLKHNPDDNIKWSFGIEDPEQVDPYFLPITAGQLNFKRVQDCYNVTVNDSVQIFNNVNYTCEYSAFWNTSIKKFWCYDGFLPNGSFNIVNTGHYDGGDVKTKTIWRETYNRTEYFPVQKERCDILSQAHITYRNGNKNKSIQCDYDGWYCNINKTERKVYCGLKADGATKNDPCGARGTYCAVIDLSGDNIKQAYKEAFRGIDDKRPQCVVIS